MKNKLTALVLCFVLLMLPVKGLFYFVFADNSNSERPTIHLETLSICGGKKEYDLGEEIKWSVKITSEKPISCVDIKLKCVDNIYDCGWEYDNETSIYTTSITPKFYGEVEILNIIAIGPDQKMSGYLNNKYADAGSEYADRIDYNKLISTDLSDYNCVVKGGNVQAERPQMDISNLSIVDQKDHYELGEIIKWSGIKIQSETPIAGTYVQIRGPENTYDGEIVYDEESDSYGFTSYSNYNGKLEVVSLICIDANMHMAGFLNKKYNDAGYAFYDWDDYDKLVFTDLSKFDCKVGQLNEVNEPPKVYIDTLSLDSNKKEYALGEEIKWSVKITNDAPLANVQIILKLVDNTYDCGCTYDKENDTYTTSIVAPYYGKIEILNVIAIDSNKHMSGYLNEKYNDAGDQYSDWEDYDKLIFTDLSDYDAFVGIYDENGIFVYGDGMDNNVSLSINELDRTGEIYEKMNDPKLEDYKFYEISMDGAYKQNNKNVIVRFFVGRFIPDGTYVTIKHHLKNGKNQKVSGKVYKGYVEIEVEEFSPFLLEIGKGESENYQSDDNDNNYENINSAEDDSTIKNWVLDINGYKMQISMKKEIPYTRNKRAIASSCNVSVKLLEGSGISVKSVKAKKPKKNASSTSIKIKLKGSDKQSKAAAKSMNRLLKKIGVTLVKSTV